jgi:hypothetical protein
MSFLYRGKGHMDRVIFNNRITGKMFIYVTAFVLLGGVFTHYLFEEKHPIAIAGLTLGGMLVFPLLAWLVIHFSGRSLIAEVRLRGDMLHVEMVHAFGKGRKFELPIPPESDWNWYAQKADSSTSERVGIITFKWGGKTYQMSLNGARIVDEVELRKLAPKVIDEMIASKVMFHKPAEA